MFVYRSLWPMQLPGWHHCGGVQYHSGSGHAPGALEGESLGEPVLVTSTPACLTSAGVHAPLQLPAAAHPAPFQQHAMLSPMQGDEAVAAVDSQVVDALTCQLHAFTVGGSSLRRDLRSKLQAMAALLQAGSITLAAASVDATPPGGPEGWQASAAASFAEARHGTQLVWVTAQVQLLPGLLSNAQPPPRPASTAAGDDHDTSPGEEAWPYVLSPTWSATNTLLGLLRCGDGGDDEFGGRARPPRRDVRDEIFGMVRPEGWLAELPSPAGLRCSLFRYQQSALAWMAWAEEGRPLRDASSSSAGGGSASAQPAGVLGTGLLNPLWEEVAVLGQGGSGSQLLYHCSSFGLVSAIRPAALQAPRGGILADEMGLGKTVEVIALMLLRPPPSTQPQRQLLSLSTATKPAGLPAVPGGKRQKGAKAAAAAASAAEGEDASGGDGSEQLPQAPAPPPRVAAGGVVPGFPEHGKLPGGCLVVAPPMLLQQWANELERHSGLRVSIYEGLRFYRTQVP